MNLFCLPKIVWCFNNFNCTYGFGGRRPPPKNTKNPYGCLAPEGRSRKVQKIHNVMVFWRPKGAAEKSKKSICFSAPPPPPKHEPYGFFLPPKPTLWIFSPAQKNPMGFFSRPKKPYGFFLPPKPYGTKTLWVV